MKINDFSINMYSNTSKIEVYSKEESLNLQLDTKDISPKNLNSQSALILQQDTLSLSEQSKELLEQSKSKNTANSLDELGTSDQDKQKIQLIEKLLEAITGKKIKINTIDTIKDKYSNDLINQKSQYSTPKNQHFGWSSEYNLKESYYEKESFSFSTKGIIKTSDNRELKFDFNININREFMDTKNISIKEGDAAIDPLVINFDVPSADLADTKFAFDLNSDGNNENISTLKSGSGFLAIDTNNDGIINNGNELFGSKTGNGFEELRVFDNDNNGWIDENDSVFNKLKIWVKDESKNDKLYSLKEKDVGAIYLGSVNTSFGLKNNVNKLNGQIQKTGIYVKENGEVNSLQHIDFAV